MSWGGSQEPAAQATVMSIGALGVEENKKHSRAIFDCISKAIGVPVDRYIIYKKKCINYSAKELHDTSIICLNIYSATKK